MSFKENSVVCFYFINHLNKFEPESFDKLQSCFLIHHIENVLGLQ